MFSFWYFLTLPTLFSQWTDIFVFLLAPKKIQKNSRNFLLRRRFLRVIDPLGEKSKFTDKEGIYSKQVLLRISDFTMPVCSSNDTVTFLANESCNLRELFFVNYIVVSRRRVKSLRLTCHVLEDRPRGEREKGGKYSWRNRGHPIMRLTGRSFMHSACPAITSPF